MAGPSGFAAYAIMKPLWLAIFGVSAGTEQPSFIEVQLAVLETHLRAHTVLSLLYLGTSALALMMVSWVLVAPASW